MRKLYEKLLRPRKESLFHPDSPGMRVEVERTWVGRLFKPLHFATLGEAIAQSKKRLH